VTGAFGLGLALGALLFSICPASASAAPPTPVTAKASPPRLTAFRTDDELRRYLRRLQGVGPSSPVYAPSPPGAANTVEEMVVVTAEKRAPSITNNQEAGVDEGDIVKLRGDILVILRRGRLFTVSLAKGRMQPIAAIDAHPPGVDASSDWYDEMLVAGDRVAVIGYSYSRGGTEINRFRLDAAGHLRFEDAYQLKSNDYYSARNYASRLIGHRLIFYTPLYLNWRRDPLEALPTERHWRGQKGELGFKRIADPRRVYIPPGPAGRDEVDTLHTVTTCDLAAAEMTCEATGVLGPGSRNFYVSNSSVYLWVASDRPRPGRRPRVGSALYRLPLDGSAPSAIGVRGAPVDQFSFREDAMRGALNVLVRSEGGGDAMWRSTFSEGAVALLTIPLAQLGDGTGELPDTQYRLLPSPPGHSFEFHNRFVGRYLLYGSSAERSVTSGWQGFVTAAPVRGGATLQLPVSHDIDRIEPMGSDAVVIGGAGADLVFSSVDLGRGAPRIGDTFTQVQASEGESRSHGFFFQPDAATADGASGVLGLPIARPAAPAYSELFDTSAAMVFVRRQDRKLRPFGEIAASRTGAVDDRCQASCVDWYGNARPIFIGKRTFALLGYELVEGALGTGGVKEIGRVNFAPAPARPTTVP